LASAKFIVAVVDDDPGVLKSLERLLKTNGYAARPYISALEFLKDGGLFKIDCIISDIGMPDINGFELQRLAGIQRPELPVILITARPDLCSLDAAAANNRGFLQKPFSSLDLLGALAVALNDPR
jgi:FixJ family two-component response regulator